jgi:hypothetical protein
LLRRRLERRPTGSEESMSNKSRFIDGLSTAAKDT